MSRQDASIMHVDLDAFFAAVEQRDKPSLRGKPVIVGGTGSRGVVATASYEARAFGAHSAMPTAQARRQCPAGTAFLTGRHAAYRISSQQVMDVLRTVTPLIEQVSVDEAYLDLLGAGDNNPLHAASPADVAARLQHQITDATGGLTASVGMATTKMMAKIASELSKPAGIHVVAPGTERALLDPMPVRAISGVGPATARTLRGFGVDTVADLARVHLPDLISIFGHAHGASLYALARARDEREVTAHRTTKSISAEETFETDVADPAALAAEVQRLAQRVAGKLDTSTGFAKTITVKARWHDFRTVTRSGSLPFATGDPAVIAREASRLLASVEVADGLRLLGVGVSGLMAHTQVELSLGEGATSWQVPLPGVDHPDASSSEVPDSGEAHLGAEETPGPPSTHRWSTGADVLHTKYGTGWVWGSGARVVTVRFEGPTTQPGRVRTFAVDDPELSPTDPPDWRIEGLGAC